MKRMIFGAFACAAAISAPPALAQPAQTFTYYNRPDATLGEAQADIEACRPAIVALSQPFDGSGTTMGGSMYGPIGMLVGAAMDAQDQRIATLRAMQTNYDSCMSVRGWRIVEVEGATAQEFDALAQADLALRMETLVGEAAPTGRVTAFANEYATGESNGIGIGYTDMRGITARGPESLTMRLMPDSYLQLPSSSRNLARGATTAQARAHAEARRQAQASQRVQTAALFGRSREPAVALTTAQIAALAPDVTAVVVRVWGGPWQSAVALVRADAAEGDSAQDSIIVTIPQRRRAGQSYETFVFAVPPGHWRVTGMTSNGRFTSFCLGAPGFDVAAGEAVFAGSFAFGVAGERRPDMTVERTYTELSSAPALTQRMRAAVYRNGETFECGAGASFVHALEVRDAPFVEGYEWGSLAQVSATREATPAPSEAPPLAEPTPVSQPLN